VSGAAADLRTPPASTSYPPAVVFDCDGTLADTESLSDQAWRESLTAHGYEPTEADFRAVIGHPFPQNWAYFSARIDLGDQATFRARLRGRFLELFDRDLELHDDAVDTLRELAAAGVPIAVASSSSHEHVLRVLDRGDLTDLVGAVVGADDVSRHKPDPTPYVVAARQLGVEAARCSAVEDTVVGVASAVAAGMFTVAVVRSHGDPEALAAAHRVVDEVTVESLRRPAEEMT
jgi:HAD superfamily hydrolase (TIGR01509 family)